MTAICSRHSPIEAYRSPGRRARLELTVLRDESRSLRYLTVDTSVRIRRQAPIWRTVKRRTDREVEVVGRRLTPSDIDACRSRTPAAGMVLGQITYRQANGFDFFRRSGPGQKNGDLFS